jgi:hypothetical protein
MIPFSHDWKFINIMPFYDVSWDQKLPSVFYTKKCKICGKLKNGSIYGCTAETVEELNQ